MRIQILLAAAAGILIAGLGLLHTVYTLEDIKRPRHLAPADDSTKLAMQRTTIRLTRGRTSVWDGWLGINLTHGLGLVVLGIAAISVPAVTRPEYLTLALAVLSALALAYLATAFRFFFYIPVAGTALATVLLLFALAIQLTSARASVA